MSLIAPLLRLSCTLEKAAAKLQTGVGWGVAHQIAVRLRMGVWACCAAMGLTMPSHASQGQMVQQLSSQEWLVGVWVVVAAVLLHEARRSGSWGRSLVWMGECALLSVMAGAVGVVSAQGHADRIVNFFGAFAVLLLLLLHSAGQVQRASEKKQTNAAGWRLDVWLSGFQAAVCLVLMVAFALGGHSVVLSVGGVVLISSHMWAMRADKGVSAEQVAFGSAWLVAFGISTVLVLVSGYDEQKWVWLGKYLGPALLAAWIWRLKDMLQRKSDVHGDAGKHQRDFEETLDLEVEIERGQVQAMVARERSLQLINRQTEFLATMSHELRTPLACVVGLSRMLAANEEFGSQIRRDMGTVERLAVQLLRTVDDGLAFVREEHLSAQPTTQRVLMAQLLRDFKSLATWLAQQHRNEIRILQVKNVPSQLYFDEQRVRQILINLISNAARYCQDGRITIGVAMRTVQGGNVLEWLVEDTGRGMDEDEQRHFFDPFSKSRDSQGLGLGLALVRRLVTELGGALSLRSAKGEGTSFRVTIPVVLQDESGGQAEVEEDPLCGVADAQPSAPMALLPHDDLIRLDLGRLRQLVKHGQFSEIELWIAHAKSLPSLEADSIRLLLKIEAAAKVVDLEQVQALIDQVDTPLSFV